MGDDDCPHDPLLRGNSSVKHIEALIVIVIISLLLAIAFVGAADIIRDILS